MLVRSFNFILLTLFTITSISATLMNLTLILIICRSRKRQSQIKLLLLNLAICDLFLSLAVFPSIVLLVINAPMSMTSSWVCKTVYFTINLVGFASVFTLTAISFHRSYGVKNVFASRTAQGVGCFRHWRTLALVWLVGIICATPIAITSNSIPYTHTHTETSGKNNFTEGICIHDWKLLVLVFKSSVSLQEVFATKLLYSVTIFLILFVIPVTVIATAYARICRFVKRSVQTLMSFEDQSVVNPFLSSRSDLQRNLLRLQASNRLFRFSILLVIVFVIFWLPFHIINLVLDILEQSFLESMNDVNLDILMATYYFFIWLALTNSAANPIFLVATDSAYRQELKSMFSCSGRPSGAS